MGKTLQRYKPRNGHFFLLTFIVSLIVAAALFIPFIVYQGGIFYYYGDFNVQEIPFYQMMHGLVRNGELGWNHLTDLGTDNLASYSFYLLGSPFFWMTIPFPNEFLRGGRGVSFPAKVCRVQAVCGNGRYTLRLLGIFDIQRILFPFSRTDDNVPAAFSGARYVSF